ncbi:MAG: trigger factor [Truepera sp.]|nr:trigger factor [Truepera sp.]
MQTQLLEKEAIRAKFAVTVPSDDVSKAFEATWRSLARQVKVPGFRPGKAPRGVLEARVGKAEVAEEVREVLVDTYYPQAVRELELLPINAHFQAHPPSEGQDYTFEVEVELYPPVTLPELSEIVIDTEPRTVSEEMLQEAIEGLRRDHATLVPVERPAEATDFLVVEGVGGGSSLPLDLERVSDSIVAQLIGKAMGETVELSLNNDRDHQHEHEAPARRSLTVVIKDIKAKEKPAPDDEFAKTLGLESWAEVEAKLRDSLQQQLSEQTFEEQVREFTDKLVAQTELEVPESMLQRRRHSLLHDLEHELDHQGLTIESYQAQLERQGKRTEFEDELAEAALRRVKRDLVLEKLLELRGTTVSDEAFEASLRYLAQRQSSTVQKVKRELGEEGLANYRFLLARNLALRETVRELVAPPSAADETAADETP